MLGARFSVRLVASLGSLDIESMVSNREHPKLGLPCVKEV
jgi:hypothetical protein